MEVAMEIVLLFLLLIPMLLLTFCMAIMFDVFIYLAHRKGYPNPFSKFLITLPLWVALFGSLGVMFYGFFRFMDDYNGSAAVDIFLALLLPFLILAAGIGGTYLVLKLLPKRRIRLTGSQRSKIPYAGLGYSIATLGGITLLLVSVRYGVNVSQAFNCILALSVLVGMMFYQARRAKTPSAEEAMVRDRRSPLLYLRSFDQEGNTFAEVSREDAAKYSEITSYSRALAFNLTLEQFLAREIDRKIGPLIALGNPTDYLPPEGAARTYAADKGWQEYFIDLSSQSAAIVMQMGNSDNLNWELISIRKRGLQNRLMVITPPPPTTSAVNKTILSLTHLSNRIKGIQQASWDKFAANLEKAGYKPYGDDPGPGAVVAFDDNCWVIKLVSGAKTPTEYVDAICTRLDELSEVQPASHIHKQDQEFNRPDAERERVEKYGVQIVICTICGTKNSLSFSNCINCSRDLSRVKPVRNPYL
jgi:hypothetical protein